MNKKLLVSVLGPTAIGKTSVTIELAKFFNSEIISCDSRQFYKEMNIGTAVPSTQELLEVPHHFIQSKSIHEAYTVGDFEIEANRTLSSLFETKNITFLTGGSGLFEKALTQGLDNFPTIPPSIRENLEEQFKNYGISCLQDLLKQKDPAFYDTVDIYNSRRLIRALEVCIYTQKPFSSFLNQNNQPDKDFDLLKIGLEIPREQLYENINSRVDIMMESGLLLEAEKNYPFKDLNALQTVGYKELFDFMDGELTLAEAIVEIKKNTRRYAKRQLTWYKKDTEINWFAPNKIEEMKELINYNSNKF